MSLETLKHLTEIDGRQLCVMDTLRERHPQHFNEAGAMDFAFFEENIRPFFDIFIRNDKDSITFKMMTKPASEGGEGCQFTTLIHCALIMCEKLNERFPCLENTKTIEALKNALEWQELRTKHRIERGVEGRNEL